jgi:hypothetical protein
VEKEEKKALERSSGSGRAPHAATARTTHGTTTHSLYSISILFIFLGGRQEEEEKWFLLRSIDRHWNFRE